LDKRGSELKSAGKRCLKAPPNGCLERFTFEDDCSAWISQNSLMTGLRTLRRDSFSVSKSGSRFRNSFKKSMSRVFDIRIPLLIYILISRPFL
jgi:hypothetical protein